MTDKEQEISDHIVAAYHGILDLGLNCNHGELEATVHHLQMFVMMSELRDNPDWGNWYDSP